MTKKALLSNRAYDIAKDATVLYIPAAITAYVGIDAIVDIGPSPEVAAIGAVVLTFLGTVLKISDKTYANSEDRFAGTLRVDTSDPDTDRYNFEVDDLAALTSADTIELRVKQDDGSGAVG